MRISTLVLTLLTAMAGHHAQAEILAEAQVGIKIPMMQKPTTRPMTVAHAPGLKRYYVADGRLAPMGSEFEAPISKSLIHTYNDHYLQYF